MDSKPKLETVAKLAEVSTATVSQVMRGTGRISDKTRAKVLQAAEQLHYVTNGSAALMRSGQNREVGFVINQISNPFNAEVISGASDKLEGEGYLISILDARNDPAKQDRHIKAFIRGGRGGLLWVPAINTPPEIVDLLKAHKLPTVTFLRETDPLSFDHLGIRNYDATRTATTYLAELGHRNIAYLGGTDMTTIRRERIRGYQDVMIELGLGTPVVWASEDNKLAGLVALEELHRAHPETTAIVCNGDMVALGASHAITRMGLTPGKDFSIVGIDDIQDAAVDTPPLTTMANNPYLLGVRLATILLDRIRNPLAPITSAESTTTLIVRETTGKLVEL